MNSENEIVLIVNNENRVVGTASRSVMRRMNLPHRAAYILVFDRNERLFIHKRTQSIESGSFMPVADILVNADTLRITPDSLQILQRYVRMQQKSGAS